MKITVPKFILLTQNKVSQELYKVCKIRRNPNDPSIADEFRRWIYAGNEKMPGLIKRRDQEIKLYYS